ncbi:uncharacterized protein SAPINGB_P005284 [Magnusiomyces paraingens]|uniref:SURF1-like protein n=1 Tax=Magnusiomyces paraingens TaxID=2606893 RepID=A0A5E8BZ87_9ASCO|nr:uncharacterized protein SAPINGB_P005284 [Saprochaete ingens]VVT56797.1 unnamed protein product [Saprochaete ingens]
MIRLPIGCRRAPLGVLRRPFQFRTVKTSNVDWKPVKQKAQDTSSWFSKSMFGLLVLMPIVSFGLGTWQVKRLRWKTDLISQAEDRLTLPPLPLPGNINADIASSDEFDYRRVLVQGTFRHDQEMYVGPRMRDEQEGYFVLTPLERGEGKSTLLIKRGWIAKRFLDRSTRPMSLPEGPVEVECLLRKSPEKGMFTPAPPPPDSPHYAYLDVEDMANKTGAQPILFEELLDPSLPARAAIQHDVQQLNADGNISVEQMARYGVPIGVTGKVELRNTHFQYILTWYGLSVFTTFMLISLIKQKRATSANAVTRKVQHARSVL